MIMNKNTKKNTSARKKLIPAIGMLMISGSMLATSTYAWFTMNKTVTVTGMEMKTKVSGNLLICDDNVEANYSPNNLSQSAKAVLEPVSSVTGQTSSFFYTVDGKANGDANTDSYKDYDAYGLTATGEGFNGTDYTNWFSQDYGITKSGAAGLITGEDSAKGFVDYVFYLKATADAADQEVVMTECNLLYAGEAINDSDKAAVDKDNAWRIAVFADDITASGGTGAVDADPAASGTAKVILTRAGAANQDGTKAVSAINAAPSVNASYNTWNATNIGAIATAGQSKYFKVTVRVWLEGEDTSCKSSTYALLTNLYTLGAKFELKAGTTNGVANIQSDPALTDASDFATP
jgi:hypothetical protein